MALSFDLREFNLTDSDVERIKDFAAWADKEVEIQTKESLHLALRAHATVLSDINDSWQGISNTD